MVGSLAFSTTMAGWADLFFFLASIAILVWFVLQIFDRPRRP
jgi:hypothetical protein